MLGISYDCITSFTNKSQTVTRNENALQNCMYVLKCKRGRPHFSLFNFSVNMIVRVRKEFNTYAKVSLFSARKTVNEAK